MNAIRTAGVIVAAGLIAGCAQKREQPQAKAPQAAPVQAAESLRRSLVRANPNARVGIVAATLGQFAAVRDVPAGNVAEGATVQILDPGGEVVGYGLVRAVKEDRIHVLYQADARRGPAVGDLVMPASDAGMAVEEMPAGETIQPAAEATEPSLLPPRRTAAQPDATSEAAPADAAAPTDAQQPAAEPAQPAPTVTEEAQPGDFQPTRPGNTRTTLPPVEGATDAAAPAPDAPARDAAQPAQPSPGDTNNTASEAAPAEKPAEPAAEPAEKPAAEPAPEPAEKPAEPAPEPAKEAAGDAPAPEAAKDPGAGATEEKAPETPGLNK